MNKPYSMEDIDLSDVKRGAINIFFKAYGVIGSINARIQQRAFLTEYLQTWSVTKASERSGISRRTHYHWLALNNDETPKDPCYTNAFNAARDINVELMEDEARRRAVGGVEKNVYYRGKVVGQERIYSDSLLVVLLKANKPKKYKDRIEQNIKGGVTLKLEDFF